MIHQKYIKRNIVVIVGLFLVLFNCGWEKDYKRAAYLSMQPDTDLILAPYPFYIFDREARDAITLSHYSKEEIKNILEDHDLSWDDLKNQWQLDVEDEHFSKEVNYTSHYTQYFYDTEIPIWIYGPKWIRTGQYSDEINQQHIPSIYGKILDFKFKNSIDVSYLNKVFQNQNGKPEIIVTVVVDQGGRQLYKAHKGAYPFLEDFKNKTAYFKKAKVAHLESHTAVGHMAIGTGAFPKDSKIFSNEIYSYADGKVLHRPVYQGKNKDWDLSEMQVPSFADEWDLFKNNEPVIVSQCYAARAAVGMGGHGKQFTLIKKGSETVSPDNDYVYWQDVKNLSWSTYNDAFLVPKTVQKYNLFKFYLDLKKEISTHFEAKDPIDLIAKIHHFQGSEFQAKMDGALFRDTLTETIINTKKDKDGITDLAYVTLKATDAVGHLYGWESKEAEQVLKATDKEIETIFEFLKTNYGDNFIMVVTADHGAAPMPEISNGLFLSHEKFFESLNELLPGSERTKRSLVKWVAHSQLALDRDLMKTYQISEEAIIQKILSIQVKDRQFFRKVWKREEIPNLSL
ncbi:type I phosphodiesterase/nucleotide pyrophosphatase [Leptospira montravelensis]|uniref:Type I phosphodiesterase/nucleotide pyrophosphatase n=1 Tax=Leptospira montravelensis TaxID=2484961 RepID=A0ABY2LNH9_9LEPT|nr:alkaline phosphatase family protein [Leptospira montravelensis]TGK80540.1 type I phosphodiesterase/nucleotide pyrophosphatase [Leptospira montravelensis]TGL00718.1 type I phosphodiesterase/nucleotide pyrophosphatase [Leptospira montravelensis]